MARALCLLVVVMAVAAPALARQSAPKLTRAQRDSLQTIVTEVDRAAAAAETPNVDWQIHVLRTSDGAHYVAFSLDAPAVPRPAPDATIYVRLATRADGLSTPFVERSAVMEWLKGMRSDPLVAKKQRGLAFGEMPAYGPGAIAARGPGTQSGDLALLSMERERAREKKEAAERERKAALEGTATRRVRDAVFPFEDFTVGAASPPSEAGTDRVQRSLTAGPGSYDLYVAWAGMQKGQPAHVQVVKRTLQLSPASTSDLALSSVILADAVAIRDMPYPPDQQSAHPYAIGHMDIVPAANESFTNDERVAVVFQVLNARANETGKPDVSVAFQLFRITGGEERSVGMLNPQHYNERTLPSDFDVSRGHPLFAAMAAPLKTLARGDYRLKIFATDKYSGRTALSDVTFRVVATPGTLLATAPIGTPFQREYLLGPVVLKEAAARLSPAQTSPALLTALNAMREGRFVDLLRDDATAASEQAVRMTLRAIGLYALGDPRMAATLLRQSASAAAGGSGEAAAAHLYFGAARALEANDRDAIAAWQASLDAGMPASVVTPLLVDAHLRSGDIARADAAARTLVVNGSPDPSVRRALATIHIAQGREGEAIPLIENHLSAHPADTNAQYVLLHALFAGFVNNRSLGATAEGKSRLRSLATTYIDAKARHATVVNEWLEMMEGR